MAGEEWKHFDTSDTMTLDPSYKGVRLVTYGDGTQDAILVPSNPMRQGARVFQPSTDWAQGGPLIKSYGIDLTTEGRGLIFASIDPQGIGYDEASSAYGPNHLIAACRAIVRAK